MLTPSFTITQDDEFVFIKVEVSHIRFSAKAIEMVANGDVFVFSLPPYYLRLRLPFNVIDDERSHAAFDSQNGCVDIKIPKEVRGQHFPDLDLTAKLLARKQETQPEVKKPLIEELDVTNEVSTGNISLQEEAEAHDWEVKQEIAQDDLLGPKYGFNNDYDKIIGISVSNGNDINELGNPESAAPNDRILERLIKENIKFDPEYYAADYIMEKYPSPDDDKIFSGIMSWKCPSTKQFKSWYKDQQKLPENERDQFMPVEFSKEEQNKMLQLPRKSYLVEELYKPQLYSFIVSLLFAYHYDLRENEGEHNIESAWTIGKLVPQFAFLDSQLHISSMDSSSILNAAIITGIRRALSYPFHRNYKVAMKSWEDVYFTLRGGKRMVIKCLLDLKELFRFHDIYYVYDKIWLEDLCLWLISDLVSENAIRLLGHDVKRSTESIQKSQITFEKVDDTQSGDDMIALDIADVEAMAEDSYNSFISQS